MYFSKFTVKNYKCYQEEQTFKFAKPVTDKIGSGITYILGGNNSGKTTIIESLSIKDGKNINTSERTQRADPEFCLYVDERLVRKNVLIRPESSTVKEDPKLTEADIFEIISSRRHWVSNANNAYNNVGESLNSSKTFTDRQNSVDVASELRTIESNNEKYEAFIKLVQRVIPEFTKFAVAYESGHYLEYISSNGTRHKTELLGDGVITVIRILLQLFVSKENAIIIDEPELSLHPSAQRSLLKVIGELSQRRQIIISTHSPYLMSWEYFKNGAVVNRIAKEGDRASKIFPISDYNKYGSLINAENWQMPFAMDEVAKEIFFMADGILFLEGQEDVGLLRDEPLLSNVNIFGYGVRGKNNFKFAYTLAKDLGFKKVSCLLDNGDEEAIIKADLETNFPEYKTIQWNKDDIRDKESHTSKEKNGYFKKDGSKKSNSDLDDYESKLEAIVSYLK